jgi:hypothetical protein
MLVLDASYICPYFLLLSIFPHFIGSLIDKTANTRDLGGSIFLDFGIWVGRFLIFWYFGWSVFQDFWYLGGWVFRGPVAHPRQQIWE